MSLLLDTCTLLWFLSSDPKLSNLARSAIEEPSNIRWISPVCLFEIAIKVRIGKLKLAAPFASIFPIKLSEADIQLLPLESSHIEPLTTLPFHHKDPFDRLIAATALVERLTLISADSAFDAYGVTRLW
jgi:PIN domain nuclease of toxin-antitoxin system